MGFGTQERLWGIKLPLYIPGLLQLFYLDG